MTSYLAFKRALVDAWPRDIKIFRLAAMVMIDEGREWCSRESVEQYPKICTTLTENFVRTFKMPYAGMLSVPVYLAGSYPLTSAALFAGATKDAAFAIIKKEKGRLLSKKRGLRSDYGRKQYDKEQKTTKFIKLRGLNKRHDWHTVK